MFLKNLHYHLRLMFRKKTFWVSFFLMLGVCIAFPFYYAAKYRGTSEYLLPSAETLYVGNNIGFIWNYISLIFPFLVIFPYSMSYFEESRQGVLYYVQTRSGRKNYYWSQLLTCFIGGMIIILIPFLLNILLNGIIFPDNGNDYISTWDRYTENWDSDIMGSNITRKVLHKGFLLPGIFISHPQIYNALFALLAGVTSGIMSMLAYSFSLIIRKNRLFIFLPMYIFFEIFSLINSVWSSEGAKSSLYINARITNYISNGLMQLGKVYTLFYGVILVVTVAVILVTKRKIKQDEG